MGWLTSLGKMANSGVGRMGIKALKAVPVVGSVVAAADLAYSGYQVANQMGAFGGGKGGGTPPLLPPGGGFPGVPAPMGGRAITPKYTVARSGKFGRAGKIGLGVAAGGAIIGGASMLPRGPDGSLQLPWNDPSESKLAKTFGAQVLDDSALTSRVHAPKGYVVVRHPALNYAPVAVRRDIAIAQKLWRPARRPPISVGDYQALKRADRTVKKMRKVYSMIARVDKATNKGGKVKVKK